MNMYIKDIMPGPWYNAVAVNVCVRLSWAELVTNICNLW